MARHLVILSTRLGDSPPLKAPLTPFASIALDDGEATVIQLVLEQQRNRVCLDETKGRRAALSVGMQIVGSLGLLGKAKAEGLIDAVRPFIVQAERSGLHYDADAKMKLRLPDAAGAANWGSPSYDPATGFFIVSVREACATYTSVRLAV